jgi:uncharacterized membrane protein
LAKLCPSSFHFALKICFRLIPLWKNKLACVPISILAWFLWFALYFSSRNLLCSSVRSR